MLFRSQSRVNGFLDQLRDSSYKAFFPLGGGSPEAKAWRSSTPDLRVEVKARGKTLISSAFVVRERKEALTEGEGDVRLLNGEAFLKYLPVRLADLTEAANRPVISEKGGADGHDPRASERKQ